MKRALLIGLAVSLMPVAAAHADVIAYGFEGSFQSWSLPAGLSGAHFSGIFEYDTAATLVTSGPGFSSWESPLASITVTVNGETYRARSPVGYQMEDSACINGTELPQGCYDLMWVGSSFDPAWLPGGYSQMILLFGDSGRSVFTPPLSVLPGSFGGFDYVDFALNGDTPDPAQWGHAEGLVTSFEPVPEPATLILLGAGLTVLGASRKRRG